MLIEELICTKADKLLCLFSFHISVKWYKRKILKQNQQSYKKKTEVYF